MNHYSNCSWCGKNLLGGDSASSPYVLLSNNGTLAKEHYNCCSHGCADKLYAYFREGNVKDFALHQARLYANGMLERGN